MSCWLLLWALRELQPRGADLVAFVALWSCPTLHLPFTVGALEWWCYVLGGRCWHVHSPPHAGVGSAVQVCLWRSPGSDPDEDRAGQARADPVTWVAEVVC